MHIATTSANYREKLWLTIILFVILVICLVGIGIYSSSETALNSINLIRFNTILKRQKKKYRFRNKQLRKRIVKSMKIRLLLKEYMTTISAIAIISNIITITASTVSVLFFSQLISSSTTATYVSWAILTILIIVFGEIIPKFIGRNWPEKTVIFLFYFYYYAYWFFAPLLRIIDHFLTIKKRSFVTRDELAVIINKMHREGIISKSEQQITENILNFEKKSVASVYLEKKHVIFLHEHDVNQKNINFIYQVYMKDYIPIINSKSGQLIALLNYRKYLQLLIVNPQRVIEQDVIWEQCLDYPQAIRASTSLAEAYSKISKTKNHLVVIVDNYINLRFYGILNAKLILASLVRKEFLLTDTNENFLYQHVGQDTFLVNGKCATEMVFKHIINIANVETKSRTIGEFLTKLNKGPIKKYESIFFCNYEFKKYFMGKRNSYYEVSKIEVIVNRLAL